MKPAELLGIVLAAVALLTVLRGLSRAVAARTDAALARMPRPADRVPAARATGPAGGGGTPARPPAGFALRHGRAAAGPAPAGPAPAGPGPVGPALADIASAPPLGARAQSGLSPAVPPPLLGAAPAARAFAARGLLAAFGDPAHARTAIVLAEILAPPRALR
ncbi:MAG TPA: hypothetical protein VFB22_12220 [Candidatus Baltobacteraceae bacterium]|nr:hypothetical protein [Candidatus Baltobacteraceae bacterium]